MSKDKDDNVIDLFDEEDLLMTCSCGETLCYLQQKDSLIICSGCGAYAENMRFIEVTEIDEDD